MVLAMAGQSALWLECAHRTMGAGEDFVDAREEGGERPRVEDHLGDTACGQVECNTVKLNAASISCGQGGLGPRAVQRMACMVTAPSDKAPCMNVVGPGSVGAAKLHYQATLSGMWAPLSRLLTLPSVASWHWWAELLLMMGRTLARALAIMMDCATPL